jgi:hypothetical protein
MRLYSKPGPLAATRERRRNRFDRRSGEDRRIAYSLDYFINGGEERRRRSERRSPRERRREWRRVGQWYSIFYEND